MDTISQANRSKLMSRVKNRNTAPELEVRSIIHRLGFRFGLHSKKLPGTPDVILRRHKIALFVHGCFWHGHSCQRGRLPKTNSEFWKTKIDRNKQRDKETRKKLLVLGWTVSTIWTCELKNQPKLKAKLANLLGSVEA